MAMPFNIIQLALLTCRSHWTGSFIYASAICLRPLYYFNGAYLFTPLPPRLPPHHPQVPIPASLPFIKDTPVNIGRADHEASQALQHCKSSDDQPESYPESIGLFADP